MERKGEKSEVYYLLGRYLCQGILFALTLQLLWSILFIFCVLAPEGMNAIVFGGEKGGEIRSLLLTRKISLSGNFICSHITVVMVYSFYFLCFGSGRNECNSLWGGIRGRSQKVVAYSDIVSAMLSMIIR